MLKAGWGGGGWNDLVWLLFQVNLLMKYLSPLVVPKAPFDVQAIPTHRHGDNGSLAVACVRGVLDSPVIQCVASEYNWHSRRRMGESEMYRLGEVGSKYNCSTFEYW